MYLRTHPKREKAFNERWNYRTQEAVYGNGYFFAVSAVSYFTNTFHDVRNEGEILMQVGYAFR